MAEYTIYSSDKGELVTCSIGDIVETQQDLLNRGYIIQSFTLNTELDEIYMHVELAVNFLSTHVAPSEEELAMLRSRHGFGDWPIPLPEEGYMCPKCESKRFIVEHANFVHAGEKGVVNDILYSNCKCLDCGCKFGISKEIKNED